MCTTLRDYVSTMTFVLQNITTSDSTRNTSHGMKYGHVVSFYCLMFDYFSLDDLTTHQQLRVLIDCTECSGRHTLSGACIEPKALNELFPDWKEQGVSTCLC